MRIEQNLAAYHSIVWVACDLGGRIIVADSNEGALPEFVAANAERTELLSRKLCGLSAIDRQRTPAINYDRLASMGFYCFCNDDPYDGGKYDLRATPEHPITIDSLDAQTKQLLLQHRLPIDVVGCKSFLIADA